MATEYTPNYNLDLYSGDDKPNLRDQYNSAMNKIDSELLELANKDTSAANLIYALQQNLKNLESDVTENTANIATNKAAITANTNAIDTLQTQFGDADSSIKDLQTNVATNTTNIATNKTAIENINTSLNGYTVDIANLTTKVDNTASQFDQLKSDVEQYDTRITEAQTNASNALSLAQTNEQDIGLAEADITQLTQASKTINTRVDNTTLVEGWSVENIPCKTLFSNDDGVNSNISIFTNTAKTLFKVAGFISFIGNNTAYTNDSIAGYTVPSDYHSKRIKSNFIDPIDSAMIYPSIGLCYDRSSSGLDVSMIFMLYLVIATDGSLNLLYKFTPTSFESGRRYSMMFIQTPLTLVQQNLTVPDYPEID